MIERMPTKEYMAKEGMGFKLLKRVPYGSQFAWGTRGPRTFDLHLPNDRNNKWGLWGATDGMPTVREWFDTPVREWI